MPSALLCIALLAPSAALQLHTADSKASQATTDAIDNIRPKYASPEGVEIIWQRPKGRVRGILVYLHGCHGRATNMFTTQGSDGFHLDVCNFTKGGQCQGFTEEVMMRQKARRQGYLVAAVSGGVGNPRGCFNSNDVPRVQLALRHLVEQEPDTADKKVILSGFSSGGRVLPELVATGVGVKNAKCIVPIADEVRVKGDAHAELGVTPNYPEDVNALFVHFLRDAERENNIRMNMKQMNDLGVKVGNLELPVGVAVTPELFYSEGFGPDMATSRKLVKALQKHRLVDGHKTLQKHPAKDDGENWKEAFNDPAFKEGKETLMNKAGGKAKLAKIFEIPLSLHYMAGGRYLQSIIRFCEQSGNKRVHDGTNPKFDLLQKVREINKAQDEWKQEEKQKTKGLKGKDKAHRNYNAQTDKIFSDTSSQKTV